MPIPRLPASLVMFALFLGTGVVRAQQANEEAVQARPPSPPVVHTSSPVPDLRPASNPSAGAERERIGPPPVDRLRMPQAKPRHPQGPPIQTTADSMDMDQTSGVITARGNVVVTRADVKLLADTVQVNTRTKDVKATGHVRLRQGVRQWNSESIEYNFDTGAMKTGRARAQLERGIFVEGRSLEGQDNTRYVIKDSYLTTSDYDQPGWKLRASTMEVYPGSRVAFHNVVLMVGSLPVFYFPYVVFMLDDSYDGLNTGTNVQIGSKSGWGFFVLNSYSTAITDDLRATYLFDYRRERGLAAGVDLRYKAGDPYDPARAGEFQPRVTGKIRAYFAEDTKVRGNPTVDVVSSTGSTTGQTVDPNRYQVRVVQHVDLREDLYGKLKVNKLSDVNFLQDFFEKEYQRDPQPDNFFEFTKWSPNTTLSLMARAQVNDFDTTTERLPELRYDLKRQPIPESPLFYEGENSVAYLSREYSKFSPEFPDYFATRVDTFHQILYPKQYFGWLTFTPRIGGRATFYDRSPPTENGPPLVRAAATTGFEASFKATRTWKRVKDAKWEIDGLRHIVEPSVVYGFTMRPNHRPNELYQFDVDRSSYGINKDLVPITWPQYTGIDSIDRRNVVRPGIRQRLQTKRDGATWDLAELYLYQDYNIQKVEGEKTFSDLFAEFTAKPLRWLALGTNLRYDYDNLQFREIENNISVFSKKTWKVSLTHNYFRGQADQVGANFGWQINEDWALRTQHRFETTTGNLYEQSYALDRDLHAWLVSLSFSQLRPLNQASDLRFWLTFTLKALPEITLDSRKIGPSGN